MSGLGGMHKKYSWLPESNPAALSGDGANATRSGSGDKAAKGGRGRGKATRGHDKSLDKGPDDGPAVDALGITTPAAGGSTQGAATAASGDIGGMANSPAMQPASSAAGQGTPTGSSRPRRARKGSVDDLVRSRFLTNMAAQCEGPPADGGSPALRRAAAEQPPMAAITANVRDALAHERSAARGSPAAAASPTGARARNGHRSGHQGNGAPGYGAPGWSAPQLGSIESRYSFPSYTPMNPRNVTSTMRRGERGVGSYARTVPFDVPTGENVIVIHPGSRWLRIGRASDAVPRTIPHVIARRLKTRVPPAASADAAAADAAAAAPAADAMDVDEPEPTSAHTESIHADGSDSDEDETSRSDSEGLVAGEELSAVDATLNMLRTALKQHQRLSKRKVAPNARSQVLSYNRQSKPEVIQDHNDPFRIEWVRAAEVTSDRVVGEEALRLDSADEFFIRYPVRNGYFNIEDYAGIEEVLGDIQAIWEHAIEAELGIRRRDLAAFGAMLVIPDNYSRLEVISLAEMLLRRMGFQQLLVQQSSALVTFGAGFSSACVVDVGAQKTSVCCVDEGHCAQESRVTTMYGGDDITRFLFNLFARSKFPYREAALSRVYDWAMLNELRERFCTVNLSDVNIRLHDFFVRQPREHTRKYSFKTYDEAYQAPLCLFYPAIMDAYYQLPDYAGSFAAAHYPETYGEARAVPPLGAVTPSQFGMLPSRAVEVEPEVELDLAAAAAAAGPSAAGPPAAEPAAPDSRPPSVPPAESHVRYMPDPDAQHSRMPLDAAITHSIAHAGSVDRAKKLYTSIVIVGGGVSFIPGFDILLASRLMHIRPSYLQSVERADIVSAPRDLDPRVLAWKGGAVLSRLECAREMWLSSRDWADFGPKLLRDRLLFQW
ncbi:actin-like protein arp8 [Coemansia helicoidea]|uniref:Actin-like protein arp8 n=1 Tax=Coemansia helicoidea TaxID=1286919 RepID=A0ACC1L6V7_9FUNG|nr:actin-like protein arp8 [Coemansia helicoidea]